MAGYDMADFHAISAILTTRLWSWARGATSRGVEHHSSNRLKTPFLTKAVVVLAVSPLAVATIALHSIYTACGSIAAP